MMDLAVSNEAINGTSTTACSLRLVQPHEFATYWPLVRAGVEKVHERAGNGWLPEDVYMSCKGGQSLLFVAFVHDYYTGFVVATPAIGWTGPQLHLWCVFNRGERDVLETFLPDLVRIAKERGVQRITMSSPRKGWERRAADLGFHFTESHYTLEV